MLLSLSYVSTKTKIIEHVVELVYTQNLNFCVSGHEGSSPSMLTGELYEIQMRFVSHRPDLVISRKGIRRGSGGIAHRIFWR